MANTPRTVIKLFWLAGVFILLMVACGGQVEETPTLVTREATNTPSIVTSDTPEILPEVIEPPITGPTPMPGVPFSLPTSPFQMPLDFVVLEPSSIGMLEPFGQLTFDMMSTFIPDASLVSSPSGYSLAAHLDDGALVVWDVATGDVLAMDWSKRGGGQTGSYAALDVSPAYEEYLATSATVSLDENADLRSAVYMWEMDGMGEPIMLPGTSLYGDRYLDPMGVMSVAFSPDGSLLAAGLRLGEGQGGLVRIWDVSDKTLIQELNYVEAVSEVSFSPNAGLLLVSSGNNLIYVDPTNGEELQKAHFEFSIEGLTISPSGGWLAVYGDRVALVETSSGDTILTFPASDSIDAVAFSTQESLLAVVDGNNLRFLDLDSGVEVQNHQGQSKFLDVVFLQTGRMMATIDEQAQVLLWGAQGHLTLQPELSTISLTSVSSLESAAQLFVPKLVDLAFSDNRDWLALGSSDGIYIVDLPGMTLREFLPQVDLYSAIFSISSDGRWLAWVAENGLVKIWDAVEGSLAYELTDLGEGCCRKVQLSPNGDILVVSDGMVGRVWDLQTREEIYSRESVQNAELSPDGSRVAFESAWDIKVTIWDIATRQDLRELSGFSTAAPYYYTKFSPNWDSMMWAARANMQFTDVSSGQLGPEVAFSWGNFTPDGTLAAVVEEGFYYTTLGEVHLIDASSGETVRVFDHDEEMIVDALDFSPDGRLLATAIGDTIKIWDVARGTELVTLPKAVGDIRRLLFSPDGRILVTFGVGNVIDFWVVPRDAATKAPSIIAADLVEIDRVEVEDPTDVAFSPDENFLAIATKSGGINLWDLQANRLTELPTPHTDWVYQIAFSTDGQYLVSSPRDGTPRVWDASSQELLTNYPSGSRGEICAIDFIQGNILAAAGQDHQIVVWEMPRFANRGFQMAQAAWIWGLDVSNDGSFLAAASADGQIYIFNIDRTDSGSYTFVPSAILTGHTATVWSVAFAGDNRRLASGSWDGTIRIWDVYDGKTELILSGHTDWVYEVAFSQESELLASASRDGTVRLWDTSTGDEIAILDEHSDRVWSVDFSPGGQLIASASDDGTVRIWGVLP